MPGNAEKDKIAFYAFGANHDSSDQKLKINKPAVKNKLYDQTHKGACVCAEHHTSPGPHRAPRTEPDVAPRLTHWISC